MRRTLTEWLSAVQRGGDYRATTFRAVEEINQARAVIARLPVPAAPAPAWRRQLQILSAAAQSTRPSGCRLPTVSRSGIIGKIVAVPPCRMLAASALASLR